MEPGGLRLAGEPAEAVRKLELVGDLDILGLEEDDAALGDEAGEVVELLVGVGRVEDRAQLRGRICRQRSDREWDAGK